MHIIFEKHQYEVAKVQRALDGITTLQDVEQKISVGYVGYYYYPTIFVNKERRYIASKNIEGHLFEKDREVVRDEHGEIVPPELHWHWRSTKEPLHRSRRPTGCSASSLKLRA